MTAEDRVAVKDYIDARITPLDRDVKEIKRTLTGITQKLDSLQTSDDRADGAQAMKGTIWKAAAVIVTTLAAVVGVAVAVMA